MPLTIAAHRDRLKLEEGRLLIDGEWLPATAGGSWTHHHPGTGEAVGSFAIADAGDVDRAVRAARRAFDDGPWGRSNARERIVTLMRIAEVIREHGAELSEVQVLDNGIPLTFSDVYVFSADMLADIFVHHAGWIDKAGGETLPPFQGSDHLVLTLRQPVGVVGAVIPWNAPLFLFAQKIAPALAAGCTVVVKPSEYASFAVLRLAHLLQEAGLPPGVLNVVTGPGDPTGAALITHPQLDKLSFTGSRGVGKRIMVAAADGVKRVSLELGGKSPSIVFPDAPDVGTAAMTAMGMVSLGVSGQGCVCHTRALVHRDVYDDFVAVAESMMSMAKYGDPFDPGTTSAPLINERQLDRVLGYIGAGVEAGARLVGGGERLGGELAAGNHVAPALFADVDNSMSIAREEIFGPVLSVIPFSDEAEAMRLANDTEYGLGATVFTSDTQRAFRFAKGVRAGTFGINAYGVEPHAPFGGFKQSGLGREGGRTAFEAFTELKTVMVPLAEGMF